MLLAAAQGRFGWKPDVMEHFFNKADLREMLGTIVKIDYTRIFYALTDSGFDGEYLSRQPDVWGLVWGFVNQAANRNGRILEELLAMPSWRPAFEVITTSEGDSLAESLYRYRAIRSDNRSILRILLKNGYKVDLAKAQEWGATEETLAAIRAAGADVSSEDSKDRD